MSISLSRSLIGVVRSSPGSWRWVAASPTVHTCIPLRTLATSNPNNPSFKVQPFVDAKHPRFNVTPSILEKIDRRLHLQKNHPLNIIKKKIEQYCQEYAGQRRWGYNFSIFDSLDPIVDTRSCFDLLRIPEDHVSRKPSDTYYLDDSTVLRTHTSAHQIQFMSEGTAAFLCCGDVYRRDEIDSTHYPVFHQMEGVRVLSDSDYPTEVTSREDRQKLIENELKDILTGLAVHLFGDVPMRWNDDYFPFTEPSFELEVYYNDAWLEVLGCGVIHPEVLDNAELSGKQGWAFGLGLERLAMVLFGIPDIRLFWSTDPRFQSQFTDGKITTFFPYSKYPSCYKDVSFWLPEGSASAPVNHFHSNDVYEIIREVAGDMVEQVELFDEFTNPKTGRKSHAYRIHYRHMDRSLTNAEVDEIQVQVRNALDRQLGITLR